MNNLNKTILFSIFIMVSLYLCPLYTESLAVSEIPQESIHQRPKSYHPKFYIHFAAALQGLKNKSLYLIDVRKKEDFKKFRIPGSLHIPLYFVKSKPYLKSKPIVLINEGFSNGLLEEECKNLTAKGFNASILYGGLLLWKNKNGPLEGDRFARMNLNRILPSSFYKEKEYDNWIVINASRTSSPTSKKIIPCAIHVPILDEPKKSMNKLKAIISKQKRKQFSSLLILNETGKQYKKIERILEKKMPKNVFYLDGGIQGYDKFMKELALTWEPREKRVRIKDRCVPCEENR